ncbi:MAG: glycosyltransferase [Actinomycetota bacterium]|nr:glycosyltransferase [Actinomycetota bacterium]
MNTPGARPPVVILSGIRWDFLWQRHQILAILFARAGYPTVFVETTGLRNPYPDPGTIRKVLRRLQAYKGHKASRGETSDGKTPDGMPPNLIVYSPLVAPPTWGVFRCVNRRLLLPRVARDLRRLTRGVSPVMIAYPPTRTTLDLLSESKPRLAVYDCSENYEGFPGIPSDIRRTERELLERVDLVSCTSAFLLEKVHHTRPDAFLSGPGVAYEHFAALQGARSGGLVRTVCFFGHLSEERVDFSIVKGLAERGFEVRLVGGLGRVEEGLLTWPGVDYWGEVSHADLPAALTGTDAFIIPYRINALTRGISPAKIYECLATGIPIVATPLPELERFGEHVYLAEGAEGLAEVLRGLPRLETEEKVRARIELARENSWDARFAAMEKAIQGKL